MQPERKPLFNDIIVELTDHNIVKGGVSQNGTPRDVFTYNKTDKWEQIKYSVKKTYNLNKIKGDTPDNHSIYYNFNLFKNQNNSEFFYNTLTKLQNLNTGDSVRIKGLRKYYKDKNGVICETYDLLSLEVIKGQKQASQEDGIQFLGIPVAGNYIDEIPF